MELNEHKKLLEGIKSDWNFSQSSHGHKVSIGVMLEATAAAKSGARKEDSAVLPATEKKFKSSQGKTVEEDRGEVITVVLEAKNSEVPTQGPAGWFSTRSLNTVQSFANQSEKFFQANEVVHKKFSTVACARKREKGENSERVEEFAFASVKEMRVSNKTTVKKSFFSGTKGEQAGNIENREEFAFATCQETHLSDKEIEGNKTVKAATGSNEALRKKLWEILGTAPSQNNQNADLPIHENDNGNSNSVARGQRKGEPVKPKQNSDTIETDSESPNSSVRRPVTRSQVRKKTPSKRQLKLQHEIKNTGDFPPSTEFCKPKCQENNIFAFDEVEGRSGSSYQPVNGRSTGKPKKREKRSSKMKPLTISFPEKTISVDNFFSTQREKTFLPEKAASTTGGMDELPQQKFHKSPVTEKMEPQREINSPPSYLDRQPLGKKTDPGEDLSISSYKNTHENIVSPTLNAGLQKDLRWPTPSTHSPVLSESPRTTLLEKTPVANLSAAEVGNSGLREYNAMRPGSGGSIRTNSSDGNREFESPGKCSPDVTEKKNAPKQLSASSMEEQYHDSLERDKFIDKGFKARGNWSLGTDSPENSPFMSRRSKRLRCEDIKLSEHRPILPSPRSTSKSEENGGIHEASDKNQKNGLTRAIYQFALVLERFKTKMKSQTSKKSSEILASVINRIQLQLQSVESQIQTDVGKFTSLNKSKRKRLQSKFGEQQERLKFIHDKFKEEVNQYLLGCNSTLEELEAYRMDLKGNAERQKASHRNLLLQAEEAIGVQLGDAERSIADIHKGTRRKMQELKLVLRECLGEGVFS